MRSAFASLHSGRQLWLGSLRQWHWISSALSLIGMLLFAATGITLNHAGQIESEPQTVSVETTLPEPLLAALAAQQGERGALPAEIRAWLTEAHGIAVPARPVEWFTGEAYLALPRPGGDAWLSIDAQSGDVLYEKTTRGAVAYLNDLHKGRNTGRAWSWFIDGFAIACVLFCVTGLLLLQRHAPGRPTTWPMVGLGLVIPLILIILFIH